MGKTELVMHLILGGAICMLGVSIGFNRPSWSRGYTTAARYRLALLIHGILYLSVFLLAYALGRLLSSIEPLVLIWLATIAVLILRLISPWPKAWLHRAAGIPKHAHDFAALLAGSELNPAADVVEEARATLSSRGIDVDADWLPRAQPTYQLLIKATTLFLQIRNWEQQRQFSGFAREAKNEVDRLRRRFDRLSLRVSRSLASIERLGEVCRLCAAHSDRPGDRSTDDLVRKIVGDLLADSCEDIRAFHEDACLLTARAVLMVRSSSNARNNLLRSLGFELSTQRRRAGHGFLFATAALLYAGMWLLFETSPTGGNAPAFLAPLVSIIVFGSLAIAIVPKLHWGFANSGLHGRTPLVFVIGAGLGAMLFAVVVQLIAGAVLVGNGMEGALERLYRGSPWIPGMFVIASTMAWLVQDHRWQRASSPAMRRLFDAATLGVAWMVSGLLGAFLRAQLFDTPVDLSALALSSTRSFLLGVLISQVTAEYARRSDLRVRPPRSKTVLADVSSFTKPRPAAA